MGTWGPRIYSNDVSVEIRDAYKELLKDGRTNDEALAQIVAENRDYINDSEDGNDFWFGLADTQSTLGRLTPEVREKALERIADGSDIRRWIDSGNLKGAQKREEVLGKLKDKLLGPQPPEKKIPKRTIYVCPWKTGDAFAYRIDEEVSAKNLDDETRSLVKGLFGRYMIIHKVLNYPGKHGSIYPIVQVRITPDTELPTIEKISELELIKTVGKKGKINRDLVVIESSSARNVPKKLIYIGNDNVSIREFETIDTGNLEGEYLVWSIFEFQMAYKYVLYNLKKIDNIMPTDREMYEAFMKQIRDMRLLVVDGERDLETIDSGEEEETNCE